MSQSENLEFGQRLEKSGTLIIRFGLAIVLFWIGAMKFTQYEAEAIRPLVENSPFMGWLYSIFSVRTFSAVLGTVEIILAILIALRPVAAKVSAVGSALAALMMLGTLSFILTTPGWEASLGGFPALSVVPGQFLLKDIVLFGAAVWLTADALTVSPRPSPV
jgi:uncharacterized membrane protein YkgB